jgi:hypothetical protein
VSSARSFLVVLGAAMAVAGVAVAKMVDTLIGLGILIVGAFLLILPFTALGPED